MYRVIVIVLAFMLGVFISSEPTPRKPAVRKVGQRDRHPARLDIGGPWGRCSGPVLSGGMGLLEDRRSRNGRLLRDHRRDPRCRDLCPAAVLFQKNIAGKTASSPPRRSRSAGVSLPRAGRARQGCPSPGAAKRTWALWSRIGKGAAERSAAPFPVSRGIWAQTAS